MSLRDEPGFDRLAAQLSALGASACTLYKTPCLERRIATRLRVRGCSLAEYATLLDRDPDERGRLLSALAVGVTSFFRNPAAWVRLAELLGKRGPTAQFQAWSVGCATGEEAYSIAMLLGALADQGVRGLARWEVLGTDLDAKSLTIAKAGQYPSRAAAEIEAVLPELVPAERPQPFTVAPRFTARVRFEREDVTTSSRVMFADLIVCRNVLIHFGESGQARLFEVLARALRPGGLLMLGKAEFAGHATDLLEPVDSRQRIYRRAA